MKRETRNEKRETNRPGPLSGRTIVVTRPAHQAGQLAALIRAAGGNAILFPVIEISNIESSARLLALIDRLEQFDIAIFISPNAVERGMALVISRRTLPPRLALAAVGSASARALARFGASGAIVPASRSDSEGLLELPLLRDVQGKRIVIFRGAGGREVLGNALAARGASVEYAECYRRLRPDLDPALLLEAWAGKHLDAITVTSSEGLANLLEMVGEAGRAPLVQTPLFVPHPRIAESARDRRFATVVTTAPGDEGLVAALIHYFHTIPPMSEAPETGTRSDAPPSAENSARASAATPASGTRRAWLFVLAIALAALAAAGWQWYDTRNELRVIKQDLAKKLAESDTQSKESRLVSQQVREAVADAQVKLGVLEARLAESQNQQIALEALYQELSRNRDEWAYAEIEQALNIATQQLQLGGNVKAALIALQTADARLQRLERPQLMGLRRAINRDIERLKALPYVDTLAISTRLDNIIAGVERFPLAAEARPQAAAAAAAEAAGADGSVWTRFWREAWSDLKQLVRVQQMDQPELPLLTPSQAFFLRENLKLRLVSARLALLARDAATYKADLKAARDWLERYFDRGNKGVALAGTALRNLHEADVSIQVPDIAGTLEAARALRLSRDRVAK